MGKASRHRHLLMRAECDVPHVSVFFECTCRANKGVAIRRWRSCNAEAGACRAIIFGLQGYLEANRRAHRPVACGIAENVREAYFFMPSNPI